LHHISRSEVRECYGESLKNVRIVTLAPELKDSGEAIKWLTEELGVVVSLGHSMSSLSTAEAAFDCGASLITHLFNAMLPVSGRGVPPL
jgi:N-acetylglucosamine-6-phosphate deacetylase